MSIPINLWTAFMVGIPFFYIVTSIGTKSDEPNITPLGCFTVLCLGVVFYCLSLLAPNALTDTLAWLFRR